MSLASKQRQFLEQMGPDTPFYQLFQHLPGIAFFAKNLDYELVCANSAFLERLGCTSEEQIIGRTDYEFFSQVAGGSFSRG